MLVDCRIGSLENEFGVKLQHGSVDCRIGSLEMFTKVGEDWPIVDCRIGSLEREGGALMIYYCG